MAVDVAVEVGDVDSCLSVKQPLVSDTSLEGEGIGERIGVHTVCKQHTLGDLQLNTLLTLL